MHGRRKPLTPDHTAFLLPAAQLATETDEGVLVQYVEEVARSVTKRIQASVASQEKIGEKGRLELVELLDSQVSDSQRCGRAKSFGGVVTAHQD